MVDYLVQRLYLYAIHVSDRSEISSKRALPSLAQFLQYTAILDREL